jgi:hypothetical protein
MGGTLEYVQQDNRQFLVALVHALRDADDEKPSLAVRS